VSARWCLICRQPLTCTAPVRHGCRRKRLVIQSFDDVERRPAVDALARIVWVAVNRGRVLLAGGIASRLSAAFCLCAIGRQRRRLVFCDSPHVVIMP
jgi:hypothetical protein